MSTESEDVKHAIQAKLEAAHEELSSPSGEDDRGSGGADTPGRLAHNLDMALLEAGHFTASDDRVAFHIAWAPLWMRAAAALRAFGVTTLEGISLPADPAYKIAAALVEMTLSGCDEKDLAEELGDQLERLQPDPEKPVDSTLRGALRGIFSHLRTVLLADADVVLPGEPSHTAEQDEDHIPAQQGEPVFSLKHQIKETLVQVFGIVREFGKRPKRTPGVPLPSEVTSSYVIELDPTDESILDLLENRCQERLLTAEIAKELGRDKNSIGKNLSKLHKIGLIENKRRKGYKRADIPRPQQS